MDKLIAYFNRLAGFLQGWPRTAAGVLLALMLSLAVCALAHAVDADLSWTHAITCADGSPVTNCPRTGYRVEKETAGNFGQLATLGANVTTYKDASLAPGTHRYRVITLATTGESVPSGVVQKVVTPPLPNPPIVTIAVVLGVDVAPAYKITATGARSAAVAGFVPLGVPCLGDPVFNYRGQSWRLVDPAAVAWWRTTPTPNVAAPCASG